jgi:hypothetical protein
MGALRFFQCNVAWRSFPLARGSGCQSFDSSWCFISTKCGSSVSAIFLICGAHAVCFCTLVTILDPAWNILFNEINSKKNLIILGGGVHLQWMLSWHFLHMYNVLWSHTFPPIDLHCSTIPLVLFLFPNSPPFYFLLRKITCNICLSEFGLFCPIWWSLVP